jgi:hypothetical protein
MLVYAVRGVVNVYSGNLSVPEQKGFPDPSKEKRHFLLMLSKRGSKEIYSRDTSRKPIFAKNGFPGLTFLLGCYGLNASYSSLKVRVSIVQWTEPRFPKPLISVRFRVEALFQGVSFIEIFMCARVAQR